MIAPIKSDAVVNIVINGTRAINLCQARLHGYSLDLAD
jgi:hypothetical protein